MEVIVANANGSTFLEISKSNFRPILAVVPPQEVLGAYMALVEPLHQRIVANLRESASLSKLRDTLLPRLLSGEIRIKAAKAVEAALP
jgi:type I restriction enzyme S subunit